MTRLIISLDYDDTYSQDPELWDMFIQKAQERGHIVVCCTSRNEEKHPIEDLNIEIVYTNGEKKREHLNADIWIDDMPENIC